MEECIYGIQASDDTKLSSIVRAIDDDTLETSVAEAVLKDGARSVRGDTLLLVDPTEIRKEFAAYAIADGIRRAFTRFGRWIRAAAQAPAADAEAPPAPLLPGFADLFPFRNIAFLPASRTISDTPAPHHGKPYGGAAFRRLPYRQ